MKIEYLTSLRDHPAAYPNDTDYKAAIKGISLTEIDVLESSYNVGIRFPTALRELLYLAGKSCYVLSYGMNKSQQEMQEQAREMLQEENRTIDRPFYAIDFYSDGEQFLFLYLDEGTEDPTVFCAYFGGGLGIEQVYPLKFTLSEYIKDGVEMVKKGYSPF